ncbi:DUF2523 family protein [Duganella sp. Dugasp56]|jgi:hypothetical protein|uniref:DUF2523 family protein n=1 Tax=Duganella sp. Dugasp56 TaxID=3243046 RepID=UPI0039B07383
MFGILMSAAGSILAYLLRSALVKFAAFFALFFIANGFIEYLAARLPDASSISPALGTLSPGIWYFFDLFGFSIGLPAILSAWVLRFMIRRIPVIG